jgi:lipopolysaccharide export LptBFGC system permease protein LptF
MLLLDRHILRNFFYNYLIAFAVLVGLYVVLDMVINIDSIVDLTAARRAAGLTSTVALLWEILAYYVFQSMLFFTQLAGIIPVAAAAFTLVRMARTNELVAIMAAGMSLRRVVAPIILAAVALNLAVLPVMQEVVVPSIIPQLLRSHEDIGTDGGRAFEVRGMKDPFGNRVMAGRFTPASSTSPAKLTELSVIFVGEDKAPAAMLAADVATFDAAAGGWKLTNGRVRHGLAANSRPGPPQVVELYKTPLTPDDFGLYRSREYVELLSLRRVYQLLERGASAGSGGGNMDLLRVAHFRVTNLLSNIGLMVLAVALVTVREPTRIRLGVLGCMMAAGAVLALNFGAQQIASRPPVDLGWAMHWPAMVAWTPVVVVWLAAVWFMDRMKT